MPELLPALEICTSEPPTYSVIWLHGLGADGSDFESVVPALGLKDTAGVRFLFPDAPRIPVTCNGGCVMRAWYDILSTTRTSRRIDEQGLVDSRDAIRQLISRENRRGIPASRIFLAGFSQGGAVAYATALTHPEPLAGIIALSTYLPASGLIDREAGEANRNIEIFAAHGSEDDVVSPEMGEHARDTLLRMGCRLEWRTFAMAHALCLPEVRAIGKWLRERTPPRPKSSE
jgi:phospholipase/carboxylesterase